MDLKTVEPFISGEKFSNSLKIKISEREPDILYRMEFIEKLVEGKKVIHFGFADHIDIIEQKIRKNIWFHKRLIEKTARCVGIDINHEAIEFVKQKLNLQDVYCIDITKDELPGDITRDNFDFLILGELIEHIDNPVFFLQAIHRKFQSQVKEIVITAPNAFSWNNIKYAFRHTELINSDHRYWFSPYTLAKILYLSGYRNMDFYMVETYIPGKKSLIKDFLFHRFPGLRNTIVIRASL
jgi:hypothetical protein